ncbi:MAG TPA: MogA/MoaB family molybdenum cofactor biosynthesis protein [Desulfobacteraceae bacterium]|nr:MogA/MoaB family molybdenum cofactor biosynthesis protein [Desulfobacteraceae bacterium]
MSTLLHKKETLKHLRLGIMSVSTTRGLAEDKAGAWIKKTARKEGHDVVVHHVVTDEKEAIHDMVANLVYQVQPHVLLITGGTGVSPRDVTVETVAPLFDKELSAFGPLFAQLSYDQIDSAALLSRATAGIVNNVILFLMPGSLKACQLACNALIFPELGHLVKHISESP